MKGFFENLLLHIKRRIPAIVASAFVLCAFALYYFGVYDISFIKRPDAWLDNATLFYDAIDELFADENEETTPSDTEPEETKTPETDSKKEEPDGTRPNKKDPEKTEPEEADTTAPTEETTAPEIKPHTVMPTVSQLEEEGLSPTDAPYEAGSRFALLETPYKLPDKLSFRKKTYTKQEIVSYDDGKISETKDVTVTEKRLAIELYMGYILFDDGGTLYLLDSKGNALTKYNDKEFIPAYTRDREGRPLFYQVVKETIEYPTVYGEADEEGKRPWLNTATLTVDKKHYYYLDEDGETFTRSSYNDATDNRGLYFDYPSYYGISTENDTEKGLARYFKYATKILTQTITNKGKEQTVTSVVDVVNWLFKEKLELPEEEKPEDEETGPKETTKAPETTVPETTTPDTADKESSPEDEKPTAQQLIAEYLDGLEFPYTKAFDYKEGYAVVLRDTTWSYKDPDLSKAEAEKAEPIEVTSPEIQVVDEDGKVMFNSRKSFTSDLGWNANEYYTEPLLKDISSIGSYYFDHGLLRIRLVSYDRYQYIKYDMFMVGTDDDILIRPDGTRFYIPAGYKLEGYSDGMLLLSRNGLYGYMDYKGSWIVEPELKYGGAFVEGVAAVQDKDGTWGMIDTAGNAVIPFKYSYVSNISSGLVAAYSENTGWDLYTKMAVVEDEEDEDKDNKDNKKENKKEDTKKAN